jgi:hypothetical protein
VCLALALGHATIGQRWVLPVLTKERLPSTPIGPPSMTIGMLRFTWPVVTYELYIGQIGGGHEDFFRAYEREVLPRFN